LLFVIPGTTLGVWDTYPTLTDELNTIHNAYPNLSELISIGKTVQNRDIWAMRITDNPLAEEDEPEFFWNGPMHGDEKTGVELSFYMIQHLLESYGTATGDGPRITNLVNNMDLWFVPSMNWDGYMWNGGGMGQARRGNANGVDLNRNYPEWTTRSFSPYTRYFGPFGNMFDGPPPQTALLEPETVALMNFRRAHNFVSSVVFHGGVLVALYPWSSNNNTVADYATPPQDALWREMAFTYASQNGPMFANQSPPFVNGQANADTMYPISGGAMDWTILYTGTFEITIEVSAVKFPPASQLPTFWNQNRESMLQITEAANWGVRGSITNANTGAPLGAKITVIDPPPSPTPDPNHPSVLNVFGDPDHGDYHRMLLPGTYTLRFEAPGYQTQTISNVVVGAETNDPNATLRLNVQMQPLDTVAPTVTGAQFNFNASPQSIRYAFSEDVSASLGVTDLLLENLTTGQTIPSGNLAVGYDAGTNTATFTFPGYSFGALPDGNYRATVLASGVRDAAGNPLPANHLLNFFFLNGDANRDGRVNLDDFNIVAGNFGQSPRTFSQGDFDYDSVVNLSDFNILAGRFGSVLAAPKGGLFFDRSDERMDSSSIIDDEDELW
jgi:hypothetical protein